MGNVKSIFEGLNGTSLMKAVQANIKKLKSCDRHDFPLDDTNWKLNDRVCCKRCGGEMSIYDARIWRDGYVAGLRYGEIT